MIPLLSQHETYGAALTYLVHFTDWPLIIFDLVFCLRTIQIHHVIYNLNGCFTTTNLVFPNTVTRY